VRDFLDRLLGRRSSDDIFDELEEIDAAIERGENVSDRVVFTEQGKVDRCAAIANHCGTKHLGIVRRRDGIVGLVVAHRDGSPKTDYPGVRR
jgi:hypothetical protein